MSTQKKVSTADIYTWLGDELGDMDAVAVMLSDIANGDYKPKTLLSDILQSVDEDEV